MPQPIQDQQNQQTNNATDNNQQQVATTSTSASDTTTVNITQTDTNTPAKEDIVTRASQVSLKKEGQDQDNDSPDILKDAGFDRNSWNQLLESKSPEEKAQLEAMYKSFQRGAGKSWQEAAEMKRQAEAMQQQPWTTDRVGKLLQDQDFVQAAQTYTQAQAMQQNPQGSGLNDQEWSALSDAEKHQFHQMAQNQQALQSQMSQMMIQQEDEKLAQRYKNYDPTAVKQLRTDLIQGRVQATGEHLWKVYDYDDAVERAYQMGMQDGQKGLQEKAEASTVGVSGVNVTQADEIPARQQNQSTVDHFRAIAMRNMQKLKQARQNQ